MYDVQAFQNLDKNNDGFLTRNEMSKLLQSLTSEQVNMIVFKIVSLPSNKLASSVDAIAENVTD